MARTVKYTLYTSTITATSTSLVSLDILRPGKLIAWQAAMHALGGAGIGFGTLQVTINTNGASVAGISNPQREAGLADVTFNTGNAVGTAVNEGISGISVPVAAGDRLTLSAVISGTAPASGLCYFAFYVHED